VNNMTEGRLSLLIHRQHMENVNCPLPRRKYSTTPPACIISNRPCWEADHLEKTLVQYSTGRIDNLVGLIVRLGSKVKEI